MSWTRRSLLFGAGSLALAAAVGGWVASSATAHTAARRPLRALSPSAFSVLVAVADTLCPAPSAGLSCRDLFVSEDVDAFLASCDPAVAEEVSQALHLVENALPSLLLDAHPRKSFSASSPQVRLAVLVAFRDSRFALRRTVYKALLGLVSATYYGNPALQAHTGYQPLDWSGRP